MSKNSAHIPLSITVEGISSRDAAMKWLERQSADVRAVTYFENETFWQKPIVEEGAFVDDSARLMGGIIVRSGCYVGPYAVVRLDEKKAIEPLVMDVNSNLQDGAIVHSTTTKIGKRVIVAHQAIVHGAIVEDDSTLYIQAVVDGGGTVIGEGSFLHRGAYVGKGIRIRPRSYIEPGLNVMSQEQADRLPSVTLELMALRDHVLELNRAHVERYLNFTKIFQ